MMKRYPRPAVLAQIPMDRHGVLEASAGTGKTYTIEHMVIDRLLRTDVSMDQVLVVTFTDKATAELRARIRRLMETILATAEPIVSELSAVALEADNPEWWYLDGARLEKLETELFAFDRAPIHTIHAFCRRILVEFAFSSGQLLEQERVESDIAFEAAWRQTVREELAQGGQTGACLTRWHSSHGGDDELRKLLQGAHGKHYLENRLDVGEEAARLRNRLADSFNPEAYAADLATLAIQKPSVTKALESATALMTQVGHSSSADEFLAAIGTVGLDALLKPRRTRVTETKGPFPTGLQPNHQDAILAIGQLWRLSRLTQAEERADVDALLPAVDLRLRAKKESEGLFEFDDLLTRVHSALTGPRGDDFVRLLRERFRIGLIDEFQDTDARQWAIFHRIFVEGDDGILCVIGDPKQAIYGFRGADVHTYLAAKAALLADPRKPAERVPLRTNFRSTSQLIDGVNRILSTTGEHGLLQGEIRYEEPVTCGKAELRLTDSKGNTVPPITLWRQVPRSTGRGGRLSGWSLMQGFSGNLVDTISELTMAPGGTYFLEDAGERRPITAKDIYVLVRTRNEARFVAGLLDQAGIPCIRQATKGLFQTAAAGAVHKVLSAIAAPGDRRAQVDAWSTPFFPVHWPALSTYRNCEAKHPFVRRLYAWREIADSGQYGKLFRSINTDSGFLARALDSTDGRQELANVEQIYECLIEAVGQRRVPIEAAADLMGRWRLGIDLPEHADGASPRLPDDTDAVQILTIHKCKGLEAGVVFMFGGLLPSPSGQVQTVNHGGQRHVLVGQSACQAFGDLISVQTKEEDERLLYVGLTRGIAKLVLPVIDTDLSIRGPYAPLNRRLRTMLVKDEFGTLASVEKAYPAGQESPTEDPASVTDDLLSQLESTGKYIDRSKFEALRTKHAPWVVTSYSSMKLREKHLAPDIAPTESNDAIDHAEPLLSAVEEIAHAGTLLPGGRHMGRFLHESIEEIDFGRVLECSEEDWCDDLEVIDAFERTMRRHGIDPKWRGLAQSLVYQTLNPPIQTGKVSLPPLAAVAGHREMEFIFPMPESGHALLESQTDSETGWRVERGLIKGFIDFVFEHEGKLFWLDWKSDRLGTYDHAALKQHVSSHYELQANLYTLSLLRLLGIRSRAEYDNRFGGYLYIFLRGMASSGDPEAGVYFDRPEWQDIVAWEHSLINDPRLPMERHS